MAQVARVSGKPASTLARRGSRKTAQASAEFEGVLAAQAAEYARLMAEIDAGLDEIDRIAGRRSAELG